MMAFSSQILIDAKGNFRMTQGQIIRIKRTELKIKNLVLNRNGYVQLQVHFNQKYCGKTVGIIFVGTLIKNVSQNIIVTCCVLPLLSFKQIGMNFFIPKFNKALRTFSPFRLICAKDYGQILCCSSFPFYQENRALNFDEQSVFIQCINQACDSE